MWRVDLHAHTHHSSDGLIAPRDFIRRAREAGLDRIAVTDHNTLRGALEACALDPEFVIPGEEVKTTDGELLAFYVKEEIPRGLAPEEAIRRLRAQGAVISVSHPFDRLRSGAWKEPDLRKIIGLVDALEGANARCLYAEDNRLALQYARRYSLPVTAGSDGHENSELGRMGLEMPAFTDAASFRAALSAAKPFGSLSPWWVHFFSTYAKWKKRLGKRRG
jgi:hypothetical protein